MASLHVTVFGAMTNSGKSANDVTVCTAGTRIGVLELEGTSALAITLPTRRRQKKHDASVDRTVDRLQSSFYRK